MQCMSALNNTTYKAAIYTFDYGFNTCDADQPVQRRHEDLKHSLMPVDHQNCPIVDSKGSCVYTTDYGTDIAGGLQASTT